MVRVVVKVLKLVSLKLWGQRVIDSQVDCSREALDQA